MVLKCSTQMVKKFEKYLFDLFGVYEANVVADIPKTANE